MMLLAAFVATMFVFSCDAAIGFAPAAVKNIHLVITELEAGEMEVGKCKPMFSLQLQQPVDLPVTFALTSEKKEVAYPVKQYITFSKENGEKPVKVYIHAKTVGDTDIKIRYNDTHSQPGSLVHDHYHVLVINSLPIKYISMAVGWIYFFAWAISNYPQVYINFKRKSVVGVSFDYLGYTITGFLSYSIFNVGLFWIPLIQKLYFQKYGGSVIPVQINDVFFGLHNATIITIIIIQCFIYQRGSQVVSRICKAIVTIAWLFAGASLIPAIMAKIDWWTYINFYCYINLSLTIVKYMPQVYMNYARKTTVGWSIAFVILDLVGGVFSLVQMFLVAYNHNEWNSIFGDITKVGLGILTLIFDFIFMFQHYVLYNEAWKATRRFDADAVKDKQMEAKV